MLRLGFSILLVLGVLVACSQGQIWSYQIGVFNTPQCYSPPQATIFAPAGGCTTYSANGIDIVSFNVTTVGVYFQIWYKNILFIFISYHYSVFSLAGSCSSTPTACLGPVYAYDCHTVGEISFTIVLVPSQVKISAHAQSDCSDSSPYSFVSADGSCGTYTVNNTAAVSFNATVIANNQIGIWCVDHSFFIFVYSLTANTPWKPLVTLHRPQRAYKLLLTLAVQLEFQW